MNMPGFIKVHDIAICLSFAFVCSQLCVFFPPRDAYSEDLKLSLHFIAFWKEKIVDSYRLRLGDQIDKFHMNLPKEQVLAVKKRIEKGGTAKDPERSRYGGGAGLRQGA